MVPSTERDVQRTAPPLIGVVDDFRPRGRERNPRLWLGRGNLEHHPDLTGLDPAFDTPRHCPARQLRRDQLLQPRGLVRIEPLAHEPLQLIAYVLTKRGLVDTSDVHALHDVARVDVRLQIPVVTDAANQEDDADLTILNGGAPDRRNRFRLFALDASGQLAKPFATECRAGERSDFLPKARTQLIEVEARDFRRSNQRPFGGDVVLGAGRHRRRGHERDEEYECSHANTRGKRQAIANVLKPMEIDDRNL